MIMLLILIYLAIMAVEVPVLLREGRRKELLVFTLVFLPGIYMSLAQYFHWFLPNPLAGVIARSAVWLNW